MKFCIAQLWYQANFGFGFTFLEIESDKWEHTKCLLGFSWITDGRTIGLDFLFFYREYKFIE
jgi:hypothetical protein